VTRFSGNEMETKTGKAYANPAREMLCGFVFWRLQHMKPCKAVFTAGTMIYN